MNNIEKLEKYAKESLELERQLNLLGGNYSVKNNLQIELCKKSIRVMDFRKRIVLNNLYAIAIDIIERQGYEIIKKYLNRNIGQKTIEKITKDFNDIITPLTGCTIYVKFRYYTQAYNNIINAKCFDFTCSKIDLDTRFYIDNESLKCCYNMENIEIIEDVEAEAERLTDVYYDTIKKLKDIENEMKKLQDDFSNNYKRNTYTENVSRLTRALFFCSPYVD